MDFNSLALPLSLSLSLLSSRADPKKNDQEKPRERVPRPRKQTAACYVYFRGGESKEEVVGRPSIDRLVMFFSFTYGETKKTQVKL